MKIVLLSVVASLMVTSCFVSGRTIEVVTPRVDFRADTITAHTWPYSVNSSR